MLEENLPTASAYELFDLWQVRQSVVTGQRPVEVVNRMNTMWHEGCTRRQMHDYVVRGKWYRIYRSVLRLTLPDFSRSTCIN